MRSIPLDVLADPDDVHATQAWVDAVAEDVPLGLLLDTGTRRSSVPCVAPFSARGGQGGTAGRGVFGVAPGETTIQLDRLATGDVVTRDLVVERQPDGWQHPALLGMDVLGSYRCSFSFAGEPRIDLDDARHHRTWFPLTTDPYRSPTAEVSWARTSVEAIWDTGAGITLVDRTWAAGHAEIVAPGLESSHGTDVAGVESEHAMAVMAPCRIGGVEFGEHVVGLVDFGAVNATLVSPITVILGLPLLAQATWCMDFPARRWTVHR